ncbi:hypothetical protein Pan110_57260 [Gimesia panareensis]|nr:hypothetical protein Pan110_57260 [Gimesia panareensis]
MNSVIVNYYVHHLKNCLQTDLQCLSQLNNRFAMNKFLDVS